MNQELMKPAIMYCFRPCIYFIARSLYYMVCKCKTIFGKPGLPNCTLLYTFVLNNCI